jgi:MFS family permease
VNDDSHDTQRHRRKGAKRLLAWLLRLNEPVPERNDAEIEAEVERNYRWNFWVNLLDGVSFWLGLGFASSVTILPLFVEKLTGDRFLVGMVAVIAQGGWFLPQIFTAEFVEKLARKKPMVVNLGFFLERLPFWVIALSPLLAVRSPALAALVFLLAFTWHNVGAGVVATSWQDLLARTFPLDRRGRFFGLTSALGAFAGALSALAARHLLRRYDFPTNFFYIFLLAAASITLSWLFLALTREPVRSLPESQESEIPFTIQLRDILQQDRNFRHYMIARILLALGNLGVGYLTSAALYRWQVSNETVGTYNLVSLGGQAVGTLILGFLADRFGHKRNLVLGGGAATLCFLLAWLAPAPGWYFAVFVLQGMALGSILVSGIMVVVEFGPAERRPAYTGLANTGTGLMGLAAPLLGTLLAEIDYGLLFATSAAVNLLAFALMGWWVREPRWTKGGRT